MDAVFDPKLVRKVTYARAEFYIQIGSLALLYYDYLLTFPFEVKYIWSAPKKLSSFFYFCCRYSLVANLLWTLTKAGRPETGLAVPAYHENGLRVYSCDTVSVVAGAFSIFGHIGILAVWGLRTHALCEQNKAISGLLGLLGVTIISSLIAKQVFTGCVDPPAITQLGISTGVLVFLFEILAFVIAARRAWTALREDTKFWENPQQSLHYVIFSQGLLYLTAVLVITIITAVCNLQVWGGYARPLNSLKLPLSGILTARFILHLRHWHSLSNHSSHERSDQDNSAGHMSFSPIKSRFARDTTGTEGEISNTSMSFVRPGVGGTTTTDDAKFEIEEDLRRHEQKRGVKRFLAGTGKVLRELGANVGPTTRDEEMVTSRHRGRGSEYVYEYEMEVDLDSERGDADGSSEKGDEGLSEAARHNKQKREGKQREKVTNDNV